MKNSRRPLLFFRRLIVQLAGGQYHVPLISRSLEGFLLGNRMLKTVSKHLDTSMGFSHVYPWTIKLELRHPLVGRCTRASPNSARAQPFLREHSPIHTSSHRSGLPDKTSAVSGATPQRKAHRASWGRLHGSGLFGPRGKNFPLCCSSQLIAPA